MFSNNYWGKILVVNIGRKVLKAVLLVEKKMKNLRRIAINIFFVALVLLVCSACTAEDLTSSLTGEQDSKDIKISGSVEVEKGERQCQDGRFQCGKKCCSQNEICEKYISGKAICRACPEGTEVFAEGYGLQRKYECRCSDNRFVCGDRCCAKNEACERPYSGKASCNACPGDVVKAEYSNRSDWCRCPNGIGSCGDSCCAEDEYCEGNKSCKKCPEGTTGAGGRCKCGKEYNVSGLFRFTCGDKCCGENEVCEKDSSGNEFCQACPRGSRGAWWGDIASDYLCWCDNRRWACGNKCCAENEVCERDSSGNEFCKVCPSGAKAASHYRTINSEYYQCQCSDSRPPCGDKCCSENEECVKDSSGKGMCQACPDGAKLFIEKGSGFRLDSGASGRCQCADNREVCGGKCCSGNEVCVKDSSGNDSCKPCPEGIKVNVVKKTFDDHYGGQCQCDGIACGNKCCAKNEICEKSASGSESCKACPDGTKVLKKENFIFKQYYCGCDDGRYQCGDRCCTEDEACVKDSSNKEVCQVCPNKTKASADGCVCPDKRIACGNGCCEKNEICRIDSSGNEVCQKCPYGAVGGKQVCECEDGRNICGSRCCDRNELCIIDPSNNLVCKISAS